MNNFAVYYPHTFKNIHADWVVFSARSLTKDGQIYDIHYNETALRTVMLKNADKKMFLCDSSKLDTTSTYYQCNLSDIDYLVCDNHEVKKYEQQYNNLKIIT